MRNLLILSAAALSLAACQSNDIADRKRPDEFAIGKQAPLVIPPDYSMAPPRPGAPRPIGSDSQQQALEALFGPGAQLPPKSKIESQLLSDAKADRADSGIRNTVADLPGHAGTQTVDKGTFLRELLDAPASTRNADIARVTVPGA
ncbi:DUF3035 domain-containing protein [Sandaracinobacter neustonicus]|uniref:DUF3035 domain-containing protein n=1 Tax=Sandaracinobacter neustonicus TaxID=1715348 RepID=A0A501XFM9_9SPHN|nr:DUF3035 domain-containing protein [Sandaracinobacter neustonicus]TPE59104.1 DUF3035 domain-containing protein [Sandaracinobacter neustonicus]